MTARQEGYADLQIPDMERRIAGMVRLGVVHEQDFSDPKAPRVRVKAGNFTTGWIPWTVASASGDTDWEPLDVGTQVIMAAPSGDMAQAVVLGAIHQDKHPAYGGDPDERGRVWKDGARDTYNRKTHTRTIDVPAGGKILLKIGGTSYELTADGATLTAPRVKIDTPEAEFTGKITAAIDVIAAGISLVHHVHSGVIPGPANTGEPVGG